jgi:hypothetical protein
MDITVIKKTDGTREIQYGIQHLAKSYGIDSFTYARISQEELEEIKLATPKQVQEILSKLYK